MSIANVQTDFSNQSVMHSTAWSYELAELALLKKVAWIALALIKIVALVLTKTITFLSLSLINFKFSRPTSGRQIPSELNISTPCATFSGPALPARQCSLASNGEVIAKGYEQGGGARERSRRAEPEKVAHGVISSNVFPVISRPSDAMTQPVAAIVAMLDPISDRLYKAGEAKIHDLLNSLGKAYQFQFAGVAADGTAVAFGQRRKNDLFETGKRAVFLAGPKDAALQFVEETENWRVCGSIDLTADPVLVVEARGLRAEFCAFPHQGPHPQQKLNGMAMKQVSCLIASDAHVLMRKVDEAVYADGQGTHIPPPMLALVVGYAIIEEDSTQGAISLGSYTTLSNSKKINAVLACGAKVYNPYKNGGLLAFPTNSKYVAFYNAERRGLISLIFDQGERYEIDLKTVNLRASNAPRGVVEAYRFQRPANPLAPEQIVELYRKIPQAVLQSGDPQLFEFFPRLCCIIHHNANHPLLPLSLAA